MKIRTAISTFSVAAAVSLAIAPIAPAYSGCTHVVDGAGKNVRDTGKNCVKTTRWKKADWTEACGKPAPKKVVKAPEPPKATPAPPPPAPEPAPVAPSFERITVGGQALFAIDSARLTSEGKAAVGNVVEQLRSFDKVKSIMITGHTDNTGSEAYNQKLSERRAESVRDYLASQGVNPALLSASGMGESSPIADNKTRAGRQENRRVEIDVDGSKVIVQ